MYVNLARQNKLEFSREFWIGLWETNKQQIYDQLDVEPQKDPKKKQKDEKHPVFRKYLDGLVEQYARMDPTELVRTFTKYIEYAVSTYEIFDGEWVGKWEFLYFYIWKSKYVS